MFTVQNIKILLSTYNKSSFYSQKNVTANAVVKQKSYE